MKLPAYLLLCCATLAWSAAPLVSTHARLAEIDHALIELSQGRTAALEAMPIECFTAAIGKADADEPRCMRHWTRQIPAALARLDESARAKAISALDRYFQISAKDADQSERARLASVLLPAPGAIVELTGLADRTFDLGKFDEFLAIAALLDHSGGALHDAQPRSSIAWSLLGRGTQVDSSLALAPPGEPVASASPADAPIGGITVSWQVVPAFLLACDPWQQTRWQFQLAPRSEVCCGAGGAVIRSPDGLQLLYEDGTVVTLPPMPSATRILAVDGGAAWFAKERQIYRLDLAERTVSVSELPDQPIAAPFVRAERSLWLLRREVVLLEHGKIAARIDHHLPASADWHFLSDAGAPIIVAPGGKTYRLQSLDEQLAGATVERRTELLLRAKRPQDALAEIEKSGDWRDSDAARHLAVVANVALGGARDDAGYEKLKQLAKTPADRVVVSYQRCLQAIERKDAEALKRAVDDFASNAGERGLGLPRQPSDYADGAETWQHIITVAGISRLLTQPGARPWPERCDDREPLADGIASKDASELLPSVELQHGLGATKAIASLDDELLWQHGWETPFQLDAPHRSLFVLEHDVVIGEGRSRLVVLDRDSGDRRASLAIGNASTLASSMAVLEKSDGLQVAMLGPVGLDTELTILAAGGASRSFQLAHPARWMLAAPGGRALVRVGSDTMLFAMKGEPVAVHVPSTLGDDSRPASDAAGVRAGGLLYRWR